MYTAVDFDLVTTAAQNVTPHKCHVNNEGEGEINKKWTKAD